MKKQLPLEKMDLALFDNGGGHSCKFSQLKDFIGFLGHFGYPRPFRFSHVESGGPLIENLSLEDNLLLHVDCNKSFEREKQLEIVLEKSGNPHLKRLCDSIRLKSKKPKEVDDETRKSVALVKSLLQKSDFLFLEDPEKFLGKESLALFIAALVYKSATTGQIVVVNTRFNTNWSSHFTKTIFRDEHNSFQVNHFNNGFDSTMIKMQKSETPEEEGFLKIVNVNNEIDEENKKIA
jgi:ABC-type multidrug transport system ATPase subunit